jgi:hypothetical protein
MSLPRLQLDDPRVFLQWLAAARARGVASLDEVHVAEVFALAGIAALARHDGRERLTLLPAATTGAARFAHALGLDEVIEGVSEREPTQQGKTVTLTRVRRAGSPEAIASKIVDLLLPARPRSDAATLFWFVLVELLRNVVQHSQDAAGGVVAAQVNDGGPYTGAPALQLVVADNGIGVFEALRRLRPTIQTPAEALARALEPHVSGAFAEGHSGSVHNAGLGLFFVSEMAKATSGRLLLASRGATYFLDRSRAATSRPTITNGDAPDYPGTLVVFETAMGQVGSYDAIIDGILRLAEQRTPQRITQRWLRFEEPPPGTFRALITVASEDTVAAHAFAAAVLEPRLMKREALALDFRTMRVCTQSFLHALLHETVRLAWARKVPMFVVNASPSVRAQLELVEGYSLGG